MVVLAFFVFFFRKKRGIWLGNFIVRRILNNNAFVSTDEQGQEIVVMGKGIVFQKSAGDRVPFARAEQVFQLSQENTSRFQELIARIPMNYMVLSEKIIQMAEDKLGKKLDESIYITITDHIYSAVQRYQNGLVIRNTMRWEIQRYYPDEYAVGLQAAQIIREALSVSFAEDEAAFMALHFVNAETGIEIGQMYEVTELIHAICDLVHQHFQMDFDTTSMAYYRFLTHVKFFAQRLMLGTYYEDDDSELLDAVRSKHPEAYACTQRIAAYIAKTRGQKLGEEEELYLTVHIARVAKS